MSPISFRSATFERRSFEEACRAVCSLSVKKPNPIFHVFLIRLLLCTSSRDNVMSSDIQSTTCHALAERRPLLHVRSHRGKLLTGRCAGPSTYRGFVTRLLQVVNVPSLHSSVVRSPVMEQIVCFSVEDMSYFVAWDE